MPRFYFNVTYGSVYVADDAGESLATSADAVLHANVICSELTRNNQTQLEMIVRDDTDGEITRIHAGNHGPIAEDR